MNRLFGIVTILSVQVAADNSLCTAILNSATESDYETCGPAFLDHLRSAKLSLQVNPDLACGSLSTLNFDAILACPAFQSHVAESLLEISSQPVEAQVALASVVFSVSRVIELLVRQTFPKSLANLEFRAYTKATVAAIAAVDRKFRDVKHFWAISFPRTGELGQSEIFWRMDLQFADRVMDLFSNFPIYLFWLESFRGEEQSELVEAFALAVILQDEEMIGKLHAYLEETASESPNGLIWAVDNYIQVRNVRKAYLEAQ